MVFISSRFAVLLLHTQIDFITRADDIHNFTTVSAEKLGAKICKNWAVLGGLARKIVQKEKRFNQIEINLQYEYRK